MLEFRSRQTADVGRQIWLGSNQFAEMHKLICAEVVALKLVICGGFFAFGAVPEVRAPRTLVGRPNPVTPVITVGKASSRIPHHWRLDLFHVLDHVAAQAVD